MSAVTSVCHFWYSGTPDGTDLCERVIKAIFNASKKSANAVSPFIIMHIGIFFSHFYVIICMYITVLRVIGNTGDGKTTMAISLMVAAYDEDECLLITSPEQLDHVDSRAVSAVLLDDIFGSGSLDEKLLMQWEAMFDDVSLFEPCYEKPGLRGFRPGQT